MSRKATGNDGLQVYYNAACPVCRAGIEAQKNKAALCDIQWHDVDQDQGLVTEVGAELAFVRKRLHVIDERGKVQVGFDAFLALWRNTRKEQWKARLFSLPGVRQGSVLAYNAFAALLYRWNRWRGRW